jgi:hypothetical protein
VPAIDDIPPHLNDNDRNVKMSPDRIRGRYNTGPIPPDYYYEDNFTCSNCVLPCFTCSSANSCLSCAKPFHFINSSLVGIGSVGNCLRECPVGYYPFSVTIATS